MADEAPPARPRLRQPNGQATMASGAGGASPAAAFTLAIAGVVVTRSQLVAGLQPFLPQLTDIQAFENGERFLFVFNPERAPNSGPGAQREP